MTAAIGKAEAVTREVRACFNRLRALGDLLHRDLGVTAAMRAVLEALDERGEQTASRIARAKGVTRQHIQVLVNRLIKAGLVAARPNPADERAPLVAPTRKGKAAFARIRRRENAVLAELGHVLASHDLDAAIETLAALRVHLDGKLQEGA